MLRVRWRLLALSAALVALVVFTALYVQAQRALWRDERWDRPVDPLATTAPGDAAKVQYLRQLRALWQPFARAILAARPLTDPLRLRDGGAATDAVEPWQLFRLRPAEHLDLAQRDLDALVASHAQYRRFLDEQFEKGLLNWSDGLFRGEGVITVAGGEFFAPAIVSIKMLREAKSTLPVHVFVRNMQEYEQAACDEVLRELDATCIVMSDILGPDLSLSRDQLKVFALLFSSFQHCLYLDPDSVPLIDPHTDLFTQEPYITTGFVGWPDFWKGSESPSFYKIAGMGDDFPPNLPPASSETGQLAIDKARHLKTLLLACYYNIWGPDYYYPLLNQGAGAPGAAADRNTFEAAATVLDRAAWHRVRARVAAVERWNGGQAQGTAAVQHHPLDDWGVGRRSLAPPSDGLLVNRSSPSSVSAVRAAFIRATAPRLNAGRLLDEGGLTDRRTGAHLRLWGDRAALAKMLGTGTATADPDEDVEKKAMGYVVETGCQLEDRLADWKTGRNVCGRIRDYYNTVYGPV